MPKKTDLHRHMDGTALAQVQDLIARTPDHGLVHTVTKTSRKRKSCLDQFRDDILEKMSKSWSDDRIADYLSIKHNIKKVHRASVMRRVNYYLGNKK